MTAPTPPADGPNELSDFRSEAKKLHIKWTGRYIDHDFLDALDALHKKEMARVIGDNINIDGRLHTYMMQGEEGIHQHVYDRGTNDTKDQQRRRAGLTDEEVKNG